MRRGRVITCLDLPEILRRGAATAGRPHLDTPLLARLRWHLAACPLCFRRARPHFDPEGQAVWCPELRHLPAALVALDEAAPGAGEGVRARLLAAFDASTPADLDDDVAALGLQAARRVRDHAPACPRCASWLPVIAAGFDSRGGQAGRLEPADGLRLVLHGREGDALEALVARLGPRLLSRAAGQQAGQPRVLGPVVATVLGEAPVTWHLDLPAPGPWVVLDLAADSPLPGAQVEDGVVQLDPAALPADAWTLLAVAPVAERAALDGLAPAAYRVVAVRREAPGAGPLPAEPLSALERGRVAEAWALALAAGWAEDELEGLRALALATTKDLALRACEVLAGAGSFPGSAAFVELLAASSSTLVDPRLGRAHARVLEAVGGELA